VKGSAGGSSGNGGEKQRQKKEKESQLGRTGGRWQGGPRVPYLDCAAGGAEGGPVTENWGKYGQKFGKSSQAKG